MKTFIIMTLSTMTLGTLTLSTMTLSKITLSTMTLNKITFSIMTLCIQCRYTECRIYIVWFMFIDIHNNDVQCSDIA
jgi:hypothetical protein